MPVSRPIACRSVRLHEAGKFAGVGPRTGCARSRNHGPTACWHGAALPSLALILQQEPGRHAPIRESSTRGQRPRLQWSRGVTPRFGNRRRRARGPGSVDAGASCCRKREVTFARRDHRVPPGQMRTHGSTHCAVILAGMPGSRPWMAALQLPPTFSGLDHNLPLARRRALDHSRPFRGNPVLSPAPLARWRSRRAHISPRRLRRAQPGGNGRPISGYRQQAPAKARVSAMTPSRTRVAWQVTK